MSKMWCDITKKGRMEIWKKVNSICLKCKKKEKRRKELVNINNQF